MSQDIESIGEAQNIDADNIQEAYKPPQRRKLGPVGTTLVVCAIFLILIIATALVTSGSEETYLEIPSIDSFKGPSIRPGTTPPVRIYDEDDEPVATPEIPRGEVGSGITLDIIPAPSPDKELSYQEIYEKCSPSIVGIEAYASEREVFWGTGIIMTSDGYIVTNNHIIEGTGSVVVSLDNEKKFDAVLIGQDSFSDLAVLKIDAENLTPAEFGDSSELRVGEGVVAIGNPLGEDFRGTLTDGIISAIDRDVDYQGYTMTLLQTNAAINEGNSGGPLINLYGQVIGITNMKMMSYFSTIEGIAFAIPSTSVKGIVDELIEHGVISSRPALGIRCWSVHTARVKIPGIDDGLLIEYVHPDSSAYANGIEEGDVITAVNGEEVFENSDINLHKDGLMPGDEMTLTIYRDRKSFDVTIVLDDYNELFG